MKIYLTDHNPDLVDAWKAENIPNAVCTCGDIFSTPAEAIVSPANSFGFMDGGIDAVYTKRFGPSLQQRIQQQIQTRKPQELLIGQALWASTDDDDFEICISAPTMRVPMKIHDPIDVYLATRAAMLVGINLNLNSILFPGMGTSVGQVPYKVAANMMARGIADALNPKPFPRTLGEATGQHTNSLGNAVRQVIYS